MKGQLLANPTACTRTESRSRQQQPIENRALTGLSERVIGTRSRNVNSSISAAKVKARPLNNRMPLGDTDLTAHNSDENVSSISKVVGLPSYHPALIAGASVQTLTLISYFTLNVATGMAVADAIFI